MREFNIVQHGAGKNFLGALQAIIKGYKTVKDIDSVIENNNLFDNDFEPMHFNPKWSDRTNWNANLIECHKIWEEALNKQWEMSKAKKELIDRFNECYKGTFHLNFSFPNVNQYGFICILDSLSQRVELDKLAQLKKGNKDNGHNEYAGLIHSWEAKNIGSYKAGWTYDYSSLFYELDQRIITDIVERTEEAFKVESPVTIADITMLISNYNKKNNWILENEGI